MNQLELDNFINGHQWTFAKSMAAWPHWYVVRNRCRLDAEFVQFVEHIRLNGYAKRFGRKEYTYYDHDGFSYWTMGNPIDETTIVNRAKIDGQSL